MRLGLPSRFIIRRNGNIIRYVYLDISGVPNGILYNINASIFEKLTNLQLFKRVGVHYLTLFHA